ncbi:Pimeloyl-ACP methyl ester carboxylesterase [Sphingomonas sp. OV641]|uniref:alpha/beta fold hydrolase n=1 Tax=Sphingomonas sp. OV641 TaxID=1881068 RepID=UPI0008AAABB6|nr:alpha/beta hydrolase [Sphingomonas sp. OV641]SEJ26470.1 Pimeloyl-ACP methyl ester carboxylesterase [Sphingomonas sp. OV641]
MRAWQVIGALAGAAMLMGATPPEPDFGPNLERFTYPWPVQTMTVDVAGQPATMAFMDLAAQRPNGRTVVLLHGKNFCGATWGSTARALTGAGYRVIIPDQIGFCKSSKPRAAQYSFAMLATHTKRLLASRGVARATVVGHSMGGMLAMRYAIMFPEAVDRLVLVNPLGLVDRSEEGVPYTDVDTLWAGEKKTSYASIKAYQQKNYYHDTWKAPYDRWVWMLAGMYAGQGRDTVALAQAKTSEMIRTQPVAHELYRIKPATTVIVGTLDKTAFGRAQAPASLQQFLKAIPLVAPDAVRKMPRGTLIRLEGLGHSPQVEDAARFEKTLLTTIG